MRLLLLIFLFAFNLSLFGQGYFTLDDLQLKRYDSRKKYPATVLRNEPDAFPDLIAARIYQGKTLFSGLIRDEKGSLHIESNVLEGAIVFLYSWDSEATRRQVYHVTTNGMYAWSATDSVFYDNQLFSSGIYYQNDEGNVMMTERLYGYDNYVTETTYRIGTKNDDEIEYYDALNDGLLRVFHNGNLMSYETYHDGYIDGEIVYYDESKTILQSYYVNARTGLYGTYYEYDTVTDVVTIGHYTDQGIETGQWISKYADSTVARIQWLSERGNPDSSKAWDRKGNLIQVDYNYWRSSKTPGVNDYIHYEKTWYANGQAQSYSNYNPGTNDTIRYAYDVTGILLSVDRNMNGKLQSKTWHTNGQPKTERYGVPGGIAGVTIRDSVYREWNAHGQVIKERYYNNGDFLLNRDEAQTYIYSDYSYGCAYHVAVERKSNSCRWDTSSIVPLTVIDSVSKVFDNAMMACQVIKPDVYECFRKIRDTHNAGISNIPECKYNIILTQQEYVKLDSSGKIVTKNTSLNEFLDSLGVSGLGVAPIGNYEKKKGKVYSDFSVTTVEIPYFLNLFYINRRLEQLAPGSSITQYHEPSKVLQAEVIYIPQGEKTNFGISPVTVVAVAGEGTPRELQIGSRTVQWDNRPFYVFHVYGDGEVEFARTTYKDTILLQYRGERTGVYETQPRR